jgi:hypothetical protein
VTKRDSQPVCRFSPEAVTAFLFYNTADNKYFDMLARRGLTLAGLSPAQLVEQRRPYVEATRRAYEGFWTENVVPTGGLAKQP